MRNIRGALAKDEAHAKWRIVRWARKLRRDGAAQDNSSVEVARSQSLQKTKVRKIDYRERNLLSKCTTHSIINLTDVKTLNECCADAIIITDSKWICFVKSKLRKSL